MDPLKILHWRYALLAQRLDGVEEVFDLKKNDSALDWAQREFANAIADRRSDLRVEAEGSLADNLAWHACTAVERKCTPLFREGLAWLQADGRLAFTPSGPAVLARALVRELSKACFDGGIVPVIAPDVDDSFTDY